MNGGISTQVVIGSMERAEEYGSILTELKSNGGNVQGEMVDRVLDKGMSPLLYFGDRWGDGADSLSNDTTFSSSHYSPSPPPASTYFANLIHPTLDTAIHPPPDHSLRVGYLITPSIPVVRFIRPSPPYPFNEYHRLHLPGSFLHPYPNPRPSVRSRSSPPPKLQTKNNGQSKEISPLGSRLTPPPRRRTFPLDRRR